MPDKVKEVWKKILDYWNKFEKKQKVIIASVAAVVIIALIILGVSVSRPVYVELITVETKQDASEVKNLLDNSDFSGAYRMSDDALTFEIREENQANALLLLAENNVPNSGYSYGKALQKVTESGGIFPTDEATRKMNEKIYKEEKIGSMLQANVYVESASVEISIPENNYLVLNQDKETSAYVQLVLKETLPSGVGESMANAIAYMLGNNTTDHIIILDQSGNTVFVGGTQNDDSIGAVTTQIAAKAEMERNLSNKVRNLLLDSNVASQITVSAALDVDFSSKRNTSTTYSTPEGQEQGPYTEYHTTTSENTEGAGGVPGTTSNTSDSGTTYEFQSSSGSSSATTEDAYYAVNEMIQEEASAGGIINLENSHLAVTLSKVRVYSEEELRARGELENMTYEEYQYQHKEPLIATIGENTADANAAGETAATDMVDPALLTHVSQATGIPEENISIIAYIIPFFQNTEEQGFDINDYLQLIVLVLIVLLLAFVVWRSTRGTEVVETEPEISVDQLLTATTPEPSSVEDIDLQDKSEARKAIEKFVDENPDAVALLLRNWIDEDLD